MHITNSKYKILFGFLLLLISFNFLLYCKDNKVKDESVNNIKTKDSSENIKKYQLVDLKDAFKLHFDATVVDSHNDFLYQVFKRGADLGKKDDFTQSGLPRFKEGGVDIQVFAIWIPSSEENRAFSFANEQIARLKSFEKEYSESFQIAYCYDDVISILNSEKFCGMMGIEDGAAVSNNLENVDKLFDAGIRYIGLTWNKSNRIGSSAKDESAGKRNAGLTEFGKKVVKRMDENGMLVDVSHSGEKTFWDVIENTSNPIIASHSNCYTLNPHYRNLKMIK